MAMRRLSGMLCYTYPDGTQELDDDERKHCRFFAQVPRSSCDLVGPSCASPTLLLVEEDARCMEALHKIRHVQGDLACPPCGQRFADQHGRVFPFFDPHARHVARLEKDGISIEQQPDRPAVNAALKQTMRDMVDLEKATQGQPDLTTGQMAFASALTLAVVYHHGKAGRCGEDNCKTRGCETKVCSARNPTSWLHPCTSGRNKEGPWPKYWQGQRGKC